MSYLVLVSKPERDWKMQTGDVAVLNCGGPVMTIAEVLPNGQRLCVWNGGSAKFFSEMLRPPFGMRVLMNEAP